MNKLLKKAYALQEKKKNYRPISKDELDLAIAVLKGDASLTNLRIVLSDTEKPTSGAQPYVFMTRALIQAYKDGKIKIV